jgi:ferredoxin
MKIDQSKCLSCGQCYDVCPVDAIVIVSISVAYGKLVIMEDVCVDCGQCLDVCPGECIS